MNIFLSKPPVWIRLLFILIGFAIHMLSAEAFGIASDLLFSRGIDVDKVAFMRPLGIWVWIPEDALIVVVALIVPFLMRKRWPKLALSIVIGIIGDELLFAYNSVFNIDEVTSPWHDDFIKSH